MKGSSMRQAALTSGISIIIMGIAAAISTEVTIGSLFVEGDVNATVKNIEASSGLFRLGVSAWTVIFITDILAAWGLYVFLKPVNKDLSLLSGWMRILYAAILGAAILNLVDVLSYLEVSENSSDMIYHFTKAFFTSWSFGLIVFGFHIFFLGYLIWKSDYVPNYLGILLLIAAVGYTLVHTLKLVVPQYHEITKVIEYIFILPMMSEVLLGFWLIFKGARVSLEQE